MTAEEEIERLGRELNRARYGQPNFSSEMHFATLKALEEARAEIEQLRAELKACAGNWRVEDD